MEREGETDGRGCICKNERHGTDGGAKGVSVCLFLVPFGINYFASNLRTSSHTGKGASLLGEKQRCVLFHWHGWMDGWTDGSFASDKARLGGGESRW